MGGQALWVVRCIKCITSSSRNVQQVQRAPAKPAAARPPTCLPACVESPPLPRLQPGPPRMPPHRPPAPHNPPAHAAGRRAAAARPHRSIRRPVPPVWLPPLWRAVRDRLRGRLHGSHTRLVQVVHHRMACPPNHAVRPGSQRLGGTRAAPASTARATTMQAPHVPTPCCPRPPWPCAELLAFAQQHGLKCITIADLVRYRLCHDKLVEATAAAQQQTRWVALGLAVSGRRSREEGHCLPASHACLTFSACLPACLPALMLAYASSPPAAATCSWGPFTLHAYRSLLDGSEHLAAVAGEPSAAAGAVLARVHSESMLGDVFGTQRCDSGSQLDAAMEAMVRGAGRGGAGAELGHFCPCPCCCAAALCPVHPPPSPASAPTSPLPSSSLLSCPCQAAEGAGVVVYLRGQQGRGLGLGEELSAYAAADACSASCDNPAALEDSTFPVGGWVGGRLGTPGERERGLWRGPAEGSAGRHAEARLPVLIWRLCLPPAAGGCAGLWRGRPHPARPGRHLGCDSRAGRL